MEQLAGIVWIAILIVMLIIEIITLGLTTIWFAGGALVAFIAGMLGAGVPLQVTLFVVVSLVLLAGTRPFAAKFLNKNRTKTNSESLIGETGIVLEDIDLSDPELDNLNQMHLCLSVMLDVADIYIDRTTC